MGSESHPSSPQSLVRLTFLEPQDFSSFLGDVGTRPCLPKHSISGQMTYSTSTIHVENWDSAAFLPSFRPWVTLHLLPAAPVSGMSSMLLPLPMTLFPFIMSHAAETWQGLGLGRITFM